MKRILIILVLSISICGCNEINDFFSGNHGSVAKVRLREGGNIIVRNIDTNVYKVNDTLTFVFKSIRSYADEQEKSWAISPDPKQDTIIETDKYRRGVITAFR